MNHRYLFPMLLVSSLFSAACTDAPTSDDAEVSSAALTASATVPTLSLDDYGSQTLGMVGRDIWYQGDTFNEGGRRLFQLRVRDARYALPNVGKLQFEVSNGIDGCAQALPGRQEVNGVVAGKRCSVKQRKVAARFFGPFDDRFVEYNLGEIAVPAGATAIEVYVRDVVTIESGCRTNYAGTYPTTTCAETSAPSDVYITRGYGNNYRLEIAPEKAQSESTPR